MSEGVDGPQPGIYHGINSETPHDNTRIDMQFFNSGRPASIDMSLELEHQLDNESEHEQDPDASDHHLSAKSASRPVSLDPVILAGIVANLRQDLLERTKERDSLVEAVSEAHAREAELKEALALVTERCSKLEAEAAELSKKSQDDEDAIHMLRAKVEESRRGLMRLQTESKRMSQISNLSLDTSRANMFYGTAPPSSKRTSFTPLTGSGAVRVHPHRRTSSVSEPSFAFATDSNADMSSLRLSPTLRVVSLPEEAIDEKKSRRASGFFGRSKASPSPPAITRQLSPEPSTANPSVAQIELLTRERDVARTELEATRHELLEAQEAREATEHCVSALRMFITEHALGEETQSIKLPPLPTDKTAELLNGGSAKAPMNSWSIGKLLRLDSSSSSKSATSDRASTVAASSDPSQTSTTPLSRKIGGFFGGRTSISSSQSRDYPVPHSNQQEPMLNGTGSDCSSVDEPLEPTSPEHEHAQANLNVLVRDATSGSTSSAEPEPNITTEPREKSTIQLEQAAE